MQRHRLLVSIKHQSQLAKYMHNSCGTIGFHSFSNTGICREPVTYERNPYYESLNIRHLGKRIMQECKKSNIMSMLYVTGMFQYKQVLL
jgi:hypothetical protein